MTGLHGWIVHIFFSLIKYFLMTGGEIERGTDTLYGIHTTTKSLYIALYVHTVPPTYAGTLPVN